MTPETMALIRRAELAREEAAQLRDSMRRALARSRDLGDAWVMLVAQLRLAHLESGLGWRTCPGMSGPSCHE